MNIRSKNPDRLHLLDEIRGFAVVCMVFFHGFFTLSEMFSRKFALVLYNFFSPAVLWFAGAFIIISGISSRLARSNLIRGARLAAVAAVLTGVTYALTLAGMEVLILFGIIHLLAAGILIFALLRPLLDRIPDAVLLTVCAALFIVLFQISDGRLGIPGLYYKIPDSVTETGFLFPLGIVGRDFFSADYYPVFPWIFLFIAGTVLGKYVRRGGVRRILAPRRIPPLGFIGRHSLIIYILHQPVIYGFATLLELFS